MVLSKEADAVGDGVSYSVTTWSYLDVCDSSRLCRDKQTARNRHYWRIVLIKYYSKAARWSNTLWCNNTKQIELNEFTLIDIIVLIRDQITQSYSLCRCVSDRKIWYWVKRIEALSRV
jgi:hypothetical protein